VLHVLLFVMMIAACFACCDNDGRVYFARKE